MYDIVVVGAGTAGLSAAIYGVRAGKSVLVLEGASYGGQIINTPEIENYPAIKKTSGFEFATDLFNQAKDLGAEVKYEKVTGISLEGNIKKVRPVENVQGGLKKYEGIPEIELERIEHLKFENAKLEKRIIRVDNALEGIKNDGYYDIIILRYFKEWTIDEIAEDFEVDRRTIGRNRTRLIKKLQYSLFPEVLLD